MLSDCHIIIYLLKDSLDSLKKLSDLTWYFIAAKGLGRCLSEFVRKLKTKFFESNVWEWKVLFFVNKFLYRSFTSTLKTTCCVLCKNVFPRGESCNSLKSKWIWSEPLSLFGKLGPFLTLLPQFKKRTNLSTFSF